MNKIEKITANRIVLAVLITFLALALLAISEKYLTSIETYFYNPKVYLAAIFLPAFIADRIYITLQKKKGKKRIK